VRSPAPPRPIRVEELPAEARPVVERVRFETLRFRDEPTLQPLEHLPSNVWGDKRGEMTYLASDLKTRRPVPPLAKEDPIP
jgi:hypothetical protein